MKYPLVRIAILVLFLAPVTHVKAEEILMLTWNGAMSPEVAFEKHLKKLRPSIKFKYVNAKRKKSLLAEQLRAMDLNKYNLIYSSGTSGTKIVKTFLNGSHPILFNIVTDPVSSKIAKSIKKPGKNITGAQMAVDIADQFAIITKLKKIKNLSLWYDPREKHTYTILQKIEKITKKKGIRLHLFRLIPDAKNFDQKLRAASEKTNSQDALYVISSYSFYTNAKKIHEYLSPDLLIINSLKRYVQLGTTVAVAADLTERSIAAAEQANKILNGTPISKIPVDVVKKENILLYVNKNKINQAGLTDLKTLGVNVQYIDETEDAQN